MPADAGATPTRPRPEPSELTRPFWDAAARGELVRPVCDACDASFFTPQLACPQCGSDRWGYRPSVGTGRVHSFTVVHRPPEPAFETPYVVADVDVDDGWHLLTNVVGCAPQDVHIGLRVQVAFEPLGPRLALPVFVPLPAKETP